MSNVTTASTPIKPLWETVLVGIVLVLVVAFTTLGNLVVIIAFAVEKKLRTTFTTYIINLAVTDFLVGITGMAFYSIDTMLGYWPFGEVMCGVWIFMDYALTFASAFILVAISVDRYWSVCWSLHYRRNNTKRKTVIMLTVVWLLVFILWLPACVVDRVKYSKPGMTLCRWEPSNNMEFVIIVAIVGHHCPCIIMIFCYVKVLLLMRKNARKIASWKTGQQHENQAPSISQGPTSISKTDTMDGPQTISGTRPEEQSNSRKAKVPSKDQKIFITLSYILISYIICWVPWQFVFDVIAADPNLVPEVVYKMTFWMCYSNSTVNPIVYAYSNKEFREAFINVITCRFIRKRFK